MLLKEHQIRKNIGLRPEVYNELVSETRKDQTFSERVHELIEFRKKVETSPQE